MPRVGRRLTGRICHWSLARELDKFQYLVTLVRGTNSRVKKHT